MEITVDRYDLRKIIDSGQAFHWTQVDQSSWETAWRGNWLGVKQTSASQLVFETNSRDHQTLSHVTTYFQCDVDLNSVISTFPQDDLMQIAVERRQGLRLLRQDPWLCLASFILSSTKQITQIKEIVRLMSSRLGKCVQCPGGGRNVYTFPEPQDIVGAGEQAIRECKAGFRAKYIYQCAKQVESGQFDLEAIGNLSLERARESLITLPGVGPKIADCVLLFAYGFAQAFPVDVWVHRVLQDYYYNGMNVPIKELGLFVQNYFGPNAGFAQQYLFDYIRSLTKAEWTELVSGSPILMGKKGA
ncbi:MAG: hypothetical protein HOH33_15640 [Verrucomicrobia bacterium]|jgi:N-glycosylase/DNA lyase|nr:hypothetical protein [Verrucomicrobiota bacterium]